MAGGVSSNTSISGGGGGGGSAGISTGWVEANFLSKEFFNLLFEVHISTRVLVKDGEEVISDTTTAGVLTPNDIIPETSTETDPETGYVTTTTVILTSIEAKSNFWSSLAISALGQGSGGGGGSATALSQLVDVQLSNLQNGQALVYDSTLNKWVNSNVQGGSTAWADITGKPTTISGYGITDAYISNGTIVIGNNSITPVTSLSGYATQSWVQDQGYLTSSAISDMATKTWVGHQGFLTSVAFGDLTSHPTTLSGYGITDAVSSATTWWGQSLPSNGVVSGNMTSVGSIEMSSLLYMANGMSIQFKDSGGNYRNVLTFNASNQLAIGYHVRQQGYVTDIQGGSITFGVGVNRVEAMKINSSGLVWVLQGTQGLRIGNGLLTWDSANNALKVSDYNGNSANLYALGGVSALGLSSSGGTSSINSLTVNDSILVKDYAGNSKKALSVALAASASEGSRLIIGEGWKDLYHDTVISGYNIRFDVGQHDAAVTINGAGLATFNYYLKSQRYYLDASRYLHVSGSNLYYNNGSTEIQIA
jgi:hypothetical protein